MQRIMDMINSSDLEMHSMGVHLFLLEKSIDELSMVVCWEEYIVFYAPIGPIFVKGHEATFMVFIHERAYVKCEVNTSFLENHQEQGYTIIDIDEQIRRKSEGSINE